MACGGAAYAQAAYAEGYGEEVSVAEATPVPDADDSNSGETTVASRASDRLASGELGAKSPEDVEEKAPSTEASSSLLVYTATFKLAVHEVESGLERIQALAKELGGHLMRRSNRDIQIRVPKERFEEALDVLAEVGDVLHRDVRAEDVSERYRDFEVRLRNARAVRERLSELLARAQNVEDALRIESELGRITLEIERFEAALRNLRERIAYSTITVTFARHRSQDISPRQDVTLPFPWLNNLGLGSLLQVR